LNGDQIQLPDPNGFWDTYQKDYLGPWAADSWESPAILYSWVAAAQAAALIESMDVLATMKANSNPPHPFGNAIWCGEDLYGQDNCVIGVGLCASFFCSILP